MVRKQRRKSLCRDPWQKGRKAGCFLRGSLMILKASICHLYLYPLPKATLHSSLCHHRGKNDEASSIPQAHCTKLTFSQDFLCALHYANKHFPKLSLFNSYNNIDYSHVTNLDTESQTAQVTC